MNSPHHDEHGHGHGHGHGGLAGLFEHRAVPLRRLWISIAITAAGMAVEIVGGYLSGSLALLSDAGHMFTHVFALTISAVAVSVGRRAPCHHRTFGLLRAEVLAAYTNAILLLLATLWIVIEAIHRLLSPVSVATREMLAVAFLGLTVNIASILLLRGRAGGIGIRSAVVHMMADALSSVAIIAGALVMSWTGLRWIDPLLSFGIALLILVWAWKLFLDTVRILMESAPGHVNTSIVEDLVSREFPDIRGLERVRIWSITEDITAFTAVVSIHPGHSRAECEQLLERLALRLRSQFGFTETTLQAGG